MDREFAYPRFLGVNSHNLLLIELEKPKVPVIDSTLALWNARSLSRKTAVLRDTILARNIDIMVITETWLKVPVK